MAAPEKSSTGEVILFPYLAKGHFSRFVALGEIICSRYPSVAVTLASTPRNIAFIRSSLPPASPLRLHTLPFSPADHGLPGAAENTADTPAHLLTALTRSCRALEAPFHDLVASTAASSSSPLCVVSDGFFGWAVDVSRKHGAYHAVMVPGAYGVAVFSSLWLHLPHRETADDEFPLPGIPEITVRRSELSPKLRAAQHGNALSEYFREQGRLVAKADIILCNTVEEFEAVGLKILRRLNGALPVAAVGPLVRVPSLSSTPAAAEIMDWLDKQPPASVLYVSFGSENSIPAEEMLELAVGLERTERPFIWVIRPPEGVAAGGGGAGEWLPEGFSERMAAAGQGLVVTGWAPQMRILGHPAAGAFLSHCGWNSVLESLSCGVPIVGWPIAADQPCNAKFLAEEAGVCVKVGECADGKSAADVEKAVEAVMGESEKGKEVRRRAAEVKAVLSAAWEEGGGGGSSARAVEQLVRAAGLVNAAAEVE